VTRRLITAIFTLAAIAKPSIVVAQRETAVLLRIAPKMGDTIHTRLDQSTEIVASTRIPGGDTSFTVRSWMSTQADLRQIVEATDARGSSLLITIDSVVLKGEGVELPTEAQRRQLQGRSIMVHVSPDGTMAILEGGEDLASDLRSALASMPATLPRNAVLVGEQWAKTMALPIYGSSTSRPGARVDAQFRLDSVTSTSAVAFVSMRGTISRIDSLRAETSAGAPLGTILGSLVIDRKRGWIIDSRTTVIVKSETPSETADGAPLRFQLKMIQRMQSYPQP
jgi:hypothetical protein